MTEAQTLYQLTNMVQKQLVWNIQFRTYLNGVATYVAPLPVGGVTQPAPGWYPFTDPLSGTTDWLPCPERMKTDASGILTESSPATLAQTATLAQSGKLIKVNGNGTTSPVTITLPPNLGANWNVIYFWEGPQSAVQFAPGTGVTILNESGFAAGNNKMRARYSVVTAIAISNTIYAISGPLVS